MLTQIQALALVKSKFPDSRVLFFLEYRNLFLFQVFDDQDEEEGEFDPYYSVNPQTREIKEFSVMTDANRVELTQLYLDSLS